MLRTLGRKWADKSIIPSLIAFQTAVRRKVPPLIYLANRFVGVCVRSEGADGTTAISRRVFIGLGGNEFSQRWESACIYPQRRAMIIYASVYLRPL